MQDWAPFYAWVDEARSPALDFVVIPDVIDGDEAANDALVELWPFGSLGAPVWHLHESIARLKRLSAAWPRVCLGSSGAFAVIGTPAWWDRMACAVAAVCDADGRPRVRLHGLRMLDPRVVARVPPASADSTNIARNVGIDGKWRGRYQPVSKDARALVLRERIEAQQSPARWVGPTQPALVGV